MPGLDKPPVPIVELTAKGLVPATADDAEAIRSHQNGTCFDVVNRSRRSLPQHRTYWKALSLAARATGRWPTARHLHEQLKFECGYYREFTVKGTGEVILIPDSIAFDAMKQDEFKAYFDTAIAKLTEWAGFDPLGFLGEAA